MRLKTCLESARGESDSILYVDSGSTDGSVDLCMEMGIEVHSLDPSSPFSAARARNEGFKIITELSPDTEYVQFIDGDCELDNNWLSHAVKFLSSNDRYAIVCGEVEERFPDHSIYNRLCQIEWATLPGDTESCGGIFLVRCCAFMEAKGFNQSLVAGEEPELCYRLRKSGWKIHKLAKKMVTHDADMHKFSQWWVRMTRSGYAYAHGYFLHRSDKKGFCRRESFRIWFWAFILPAALLLFSFFLQEAIVFIPAVYGFQFFRIWKSATEALGDSQDALTFAFFNLFGKWPELTGQFKYLFVFKYKQKTKTFESTNLG